MNRQHLIIGIAALAVVAVAGGLIFFGGEPDDEGPAPITGPGRAEEARGIIAEIEERRESPDGGEAAARTEPVLIEQPDTDTDTESEAGEAGEGGAVAVTPEPPAAGPAGADAELDEAYERARELQAAGQLDDAQVLYFFGARQGHAPSAFAYAEMNDPNHHSPETSLLAEPDAFQAFRWYSTALEGGEQAAADRLDALHDWASEAAAAGDAEAERLLLQWEP